MEHSECQRIVDACKPLLQKVGAVILESYNKTFEKAEQEEFPVTKIDIAASDTLKKELITILDVPVLSEEDKVDLSYVSAERAWIVDPLDGTKDFVHKTGDFSVMIALVENKIPIIGLIYNPLTETLFWAAKGMGAYIEEKGKKKELHVSPQDQFEDMKLVTSRFHLKEFELTLRDKLSIGACEKVGSAGLKMCAIAAGRAHMYINASGETGEWDSAPGSLIVAEAGGVATDTRGNTLEFQKKEPNNTHGFVISNGVRHTEIVDALQKVLKEQ